MARKHLPRWPTKPVSDLAVFEPESKEMIVVFIDPSVTREQIEANTGWPLAQRAERAHGVAA
jgi:acyl CoA:acetate/3-ketoacid CoA transferase beta subunit